MGVSKSDTIQFEYSWVESVNTQTKISPVVFNVPKQIFVSCFLSVRSLSLVKPAFFQAHPSKGGNNVWYRNVDNFEITGRSFWDVRHHVLSIADKKRLAHDLEDQWGDWRQKSSDVVKRNRR